MNPVNSGICLFSKGCIFGAKIQTMKNYPTVILDSCTFYVFSDVSQKPPPFKKHGKSSTFDQIVHFLIILDHPYLSLMNFADNEMK